MKKTTMKTDAERIAANEARLAKMRATLSALETEAEEILAKGDALTHADRLRLLRLVNVAYHARASKIDGVFSVDSSAACEFCQRMMAAAKDHILMICGACYAARDEYKEASWRRHKLNARILSSVLFTVDELKTLPIDGTLCRFNEDGDTVNVVMARNYLRIAAGHPGAMFGYWYKNTAAVEAGLIAEGITTRDARPENVRFIHSSVMIGFAARETWFDDAIFTVYPDEATTLAAVSAGAHECNGRKCRDCGYTCYVMHRRPQVLHVAEVLRCSKARRAVIMAAYLEKLARDAA